MKLVSYRHDGHVRIGAVVDGVVVHLNALLGADEQIPDNMVEFLERADDAMVPLLLCRLPLPHQCKAEVYSDSLKFRNCPGSAG